MYQQNLQGTTSDYNAPSEITSDFTKKKRQVSFNFDKPPKPEYHPVNISHDQGSRAQIVKPSIPN